MDNTRVKVDVFLVTEKTENCLAKKTIFALQLKLTNIEVFRGATDHKNRKLKKNLTAFVVLFGNFELFSHQDLCKYIHYYCGCQLK